MIHPLLKLRRSTDRTPDQVSAHSGHRGDQWTPPAASLIISRVSTPQGGIFALGTASHAYLEFNASAADGGPALVAAIAARREPRTTMGGVNLVAGFRPELWRAVAPEDAPPGVVGFNEDLVGIDGFVMPATQRDAVLWLSGSAYDVVFDLALPARPRPHRLHRRDREPKPDRCPGSRPHPRRDRRCRRNHPAPAEVGS